MEFYKKTFPAGLWLQKDFCLYRSLRGKKKPSVSFLCDFHREFMGSVVRLESNWKKQEVHFVIYEHL